MIHDRETAGEMVALQALRLANFHRCVPGAVSQILAKVWAEHDHALDDAEHLLRRLLDDHDPTSTDALAIVNALAAVVGATGGAL